MAFSLNPLDVTLAKFWQTTKNARGKKKQQKKNHVKYFLPITYFDTSIVGNIKYISAQQCGTVFIYLFFNLALVYIVHVTTM